MLAPPSPGSGQGRAATLERSDRAGADGRARALGWLWILGLAGTLRSSGGVMGGQPVEPTAAEGRITGPSGWRRALLGLLVGAVIGAAIGLVLPRDDGPRRPTRSA